MDAITEVLSAEPPLQLPLLIQLGTGGLRSFLDGVTPSQINKTAVSQVWCKLISTVRSSQVVDKHLTAAANALCVFLLTSASSRAPEVKEFILTQQAWFDAFQCVHKAFNDNKPKPAFQVLEALCAICQQLEEKKQISQILKNATLPLIRTVLLASPRPDLKKACLMLSCFVRRTDLATLLSDCISSILLDNDLEWKQRLAIYNITTEDVEACGPEKVYPFLVALTFTMNDLDTRTAALKLCSALCIQDTRSVESLSLQYNVERAIKLFLEKNHNSLGYFAEYVLPLMLSSQDSLFSFIEPYVNSPYKDESKVAILLAALKVGRIATMLSEVEALEVLNRALLKNATSHKRAESYGCFDLLLTSASPTLRISAYQLLTASPATSAAIPPGALDCIIFGMPYLHDHSDAHERSEILSITRKLVNRVQSALAVAQKNAHTKEAGNNILADHYDFSVRFYGFLKSELHPHVSYQRHILSLQSLRYFFEHPVLSAIYKNDARLIKSLTALALDPFEDVRNTATNLLRFLSSRHPALFTDIINQEFVGVLQTFATTSGRGDHADAMGRLWALWDAMPKSRDCAEVKKMPPLSHLQVLVSELEMRTSEVSSFRPGTKFPLHGSLLAVSYRLLQMRAEDYITHNVDFSKVIGFCSRVWAEVRTVLCVDSPETGSEVDEEEDSQEGPKDLLAYSWRALRDSSLVMQSLLATADPTESLYADIGDICMDQLISLRHRGAFSTVAQTFGLCCTRVRTSKDLNIKQLIHSWHLVALGQIVDQADRLTRRSAGLPAMMLAILDPTDTKFFSATTTKLISIANKTSLTTHVGVQRLPQVHALNCLKEIMTNSRFATAVSPFYDQMLDLAALSMSSNIWAIRNCGLMLLRACINRLEHGNHEIVRTTVTNDSQNTNAVDGPCKIALRLLASDNAEEDAATTREKLSEENIFAALDLLGHETRRGSSSQAVYAAVLPQFGHHSWAIRDHAAMLLSRQISLNKLYDLLENLATSTSDNAYINRTHGALLCLKHTLERSRGILTDREVNQCLESIGRLRQRKLVSCPYIEAAALDVLNKLAVINSGRFWTACAMFQPSPYKLADESSLPDDMHGAYVACRRSLFEVYSLLFASDILDGRSNSALAKRLCNNSNSLNYVLEYLTLDIDQTNQLPTASTVHFLVSLINELQEGVFATAESLALAMAALADRLDYFTGVEEFQLLLILPYVEPLRLTSREQVNGWIRLQAIRIAVRSENNGRPSQPLLPLQMAQWIEAIDFAAKDYLDFPTRFSAAKALSTYLRLAYSGHEAVSRSSANIRLLALLYNLISDDDEDVRAEATKGASALLAQDNQQSSSLGISALYARQEILSLMVKQFNYTTDFARVAISQIAHPGGGPFESKVAEILSTSVALKLSKIILSKKTLFVEEKQNLYIDDISDIRAWKNALGICGIDVLGSSDVAIVTQWATEGLDQVLRFFKRDMHNQQLQHFSNGVNRSQTQEDGVEATAFHPLGLTYDTEILVVFTQVVAMSGIILASEQASRSHDEILDKMRSLLDYCHGNQCHEIFVSEVESALKTSVKP